MSLVTDRKLLDVRHLGKRFPGVRALHDVNLTLARGEVLAVIGENGAGKSTLMKILAGIHRPDGGEIRVDGRRAHIDSVVTATSLGIALIHQELNLADNLDIGANIFLGREPRKWGLIDRGGIDLAARAVLEQLDLPLPTRTPVNRLAIGQRQMVEIAKALSADAQILIMDEPTSCLTRHETAQLFGLIGELRQRGVSVLYISHRLGEINQIADRVVVLRDGENAGELSRAEINRDAMVRLMVGRDIRQFYARRAHALGKPQLEVCDLITAAHPGHTVRFHVRAGEMVGIAGLMGAGRTELLRVLFGIDLPLQGQVKIAGRPLRPGHPREAIQAGVALVPEDRKQQGLIIEIAVRENLGLPGLRRHQRAAGLVNQAVIRRTATEMIEKLDIRTPGPHQLVQYLSGGNQQKVVLGKWLALRPRVLLLDEPTRGVDVGAKQDIYALMEQLAEQGIAILFVSSDMEEILGMSDRVLVMHEGHIAGALDRESLTEESVMQLATGGSDTR